MSEGWQWFRSNPQKTDPDQQQLARAVARLLDTSDGQSLMTHLEAQTFGRVLGADASEGALRCLEGQRALVFHIRNLAAQGRTF